MEREIRWAVLGVGVIANQMAEAMAAHGRKIAAVGNRTKDKADAFAAKYGIEKVYDDFYDMFTDPDIDAIYITTPHNTHYEFMKKAIQGGKHLLVEKSITLNSAELAEVLDLSAARRTVMAEAMTIYHMPLYTELRRRIESGEFGRVNLITVNFGSSQPCRRSHAGYRCLCIVFCPLVHEQQAEPDPVHDAPCSHRCR